MPLLPARRAALSALTLVAVGVVGALLLGLTVRMMVSGDAMTTGAPVAPPSEEHLGVADAPLGSPSRSMGPEAAEPSPHPSPRRSDRPDPLYPLRASSDHRFLLTAGGAPFTYLADTPWPALTRLTQAEFEQLLDARKRQGFNTLHVLALDSPRRGAGLANAYGDQPLKGGDLAHPLEVGGRTDDPKDAAYDYWDHVDWALEAAEARGMQLAVAVSWYGRQGQDWRGAVTPANAGAYGTFLGTRLGSKKNLVWILGGDNDPVGDAALVVGDAGDDVVSTDRMARAIRAGERVPHLMGYSAAPGTPGSLFFSTQPWHTLALESPAVDAAPFGDDVPVVVSQSLASEHLIDRRVLRSHAYRALLDGAAGYAHGQDQPWDLATEWMPLPHAEAAADVGRMATLLRRHGMPRLRPTRAMVSAPVSADDGAAPGAMTPDGTFALAYFDEPGPVSVDLSAFSADEVSLSWYDPATGTSTPVGTFASSGRRAVAWPREQTGDAVLVASSR